MLNHSAAGIAELPDAEKKAVQEQLERLLRNPHFSQSRRFPSFLRFVIGQTLIGRPDLLKERTLGIEIFGRDADYDTASDPIVRVTAPDTPVPYSPPLEEAFLPNAAKVADRARFLAHY